MSLFNFPNQRIADSKKDEQWHINHALGYLTYSLTGEYSSKKQEQANLYYATAGKLSPEQEKVVCAMITNRYGDNFGPQYYVYPLIENTLEQMIGDYRNRPLKRKCLVNNEKAVIKKLDKKVDAVAEKILREVNEELQSELGFTPETEQPEMEIPEDIEEFFAKDFRTMSEEIGEDVLYQLLVVKKEKEKIYDALRHYLTGGIVNAYCDEKDGHPSIFIPHPLETFHDVDSSESVQKNYQYFVWAKPMSINDILNTFDLDKKQIEKVEAYASSSASSDSSTTVTRGTWFEKDGEAIRPKVIFMEWVSRKKMNFLVIEKDGKEEYKMLPEDYKPRKDRKENITSIEIDDVRHVTMLGPDVILSYGSNDNQMQTIGNKKKRFLNALGLVDMRAGIGETRSLAKKLLYLQDFASEILYELRLNMRQLDGNVLVYDLANVPKEWLKLGADKALQKVNFYLKRDRMQIINSKDKRQNTYAGSTNVSQKGRLQELINVLGLIEDLAVKISGVSKEAQAQAAQYAKATVAELNMSASASRTENYFGLFDSFVETLLERMILKAKHVYEENDTFTYFAGDNQAKFLKIFPDFFQEDLGIHIGDNRLEYERKKRIDSVGQQTFGNSQDPEIMLNLIRMWNSENSTEAESIFKNGVKKMMEVREENMKMQQQQMQMEQESKAQTEEKADNRHKETLENNIDVANIYANNKNKDTVEKELGQDRRKAAELEKELIIASSKENKE